MKNAIQIWKVTTNNLKGFDVSIPYNKIIVIAGISGGGKSSLAYETLYSLCHQEFQALEKGYIEDASYQLEKSKGLIPAVAIKQLNTNVNPRSTIYSYMNLSSILASLQSSNILKIPYARLKLNKPSNECPQCTGLGEVDVLDISKVIDYSKSIVNNPFLPWQNDKQHKLIVAYCISRQIDINTAFSQLGISEQNELLFTHSADVFSIAFKHAGKYRKRNLPYIGVMRELETLLHSNKPSDRQQVEPFCTQQICQICLGTRVNNELYKHDTLADIGFLQFLQLSIDDLIILLKKDDVLLKPLARLNRLFLEISNIGLGYLRLSRSIPSLSGGEIQKLNFCKILTTDLSNIAIIVDEISAQLHISDYPKVIDGIKKVKARGNTVILVEHNAHFIALGDEVIFLGPKSGYEGGYLIENPPTWTPIKLVNYSSPKDFITFNGVNKHNVIDLDLSIPFEGLTALVGRSGSGKSSIAEYLSEHYHDIDYISQASIKGNVRSTVATYLGLNTNVAEWFAKQFQKDYTLFFLSSGNSSVCKVCDGTGVLRYERSFDTSVDITCPLCQGGLFSQETNKFLICNRSIADLYATSFKLIVESWPELKILHKVASTAIELGLGHLSMNRKTQSLSGGELKRLKLLKSLVKNRKQPKILIVDEPGSGLDDATAEKIILFIRKQLTKFKAVIVIDHKPSIFLQSDYLIEIGPGSGGKGGKIVYAGDPLVYYNHLYDSKNQNT